MLTADTTITWSLLGESNSDYGLTKAACSPLPLSRHELGAQVSNLEALGSKPSGSADSPTAHQEPQAESNRLPARYKRAALPNERQGHRVPGAIRTHTAHPLMVVPPAVGLRGHGASGRPRTACLPLTRGTLCQVSYRG